MKILKSLFVATTFFAPVVNAGPIDFNLRDGQTWNSYAMERSYSEDGLNLKITGYSYDGDKKIVPDWVGSWNGLGVERTRSPNHAIDNNNGDFDMLLLSFNQVVSLDKLKIGWQMNDTDVSMMAFTGSNLDSFVGKKWQDLLGDGWTSAGSYYNVDSGSNDGTVNINGLTSQHWLVGAYNPELGNFIGNNTNSSTGTDYFKLSGVTANIVDLPEPGSIALFVLGLANLLVSRRKTA